MSDEEDQSSSCDRNDAQFEPATCNVNLPIYDHYNANVSESLHEKALMWTADYPENESLKSS